MRAPINEGGRFHKEGGSGTASIGSGGYDRSTEGTGGGGSPFQMSSQVGGEVPNGQMEGSPIQKMAGSSGVPNIDSSELYTVDKATETVAGQLENYSDFDTPLMKRYAQQGQAQASARGLTNSSIAAGAGMAQVLDKAGEFATADAKTYSDRKTENVRTATQRYTTDKTVEASKYGDDKQLEGTKYSSDKSAEASKYGADKSAEASKYGADKGLEGAQVQAAATVAAAASRSAATLQAAGLQATSNEKISAARDEVDRERIEADKVMRLQDNEQRVEAAKVLANTNRATAQKSAKNSAITSAGNGYSAAVANIDITASPASQKEQLNRIQATYDAEISAIETMAF